MATLEALAISGIRSYHPDKLQRIDFTHPITLINGKNGSGKTTIIQCLKYITTGSQPSLVNRQNCFVMDPNIAGTAQVKGDIRLRFRTAKNRVVIAKKVLMVSKKQNKKNLQSRVVQQSLKTKDEQGKQIEVNQRCTDIQKQIPQMLNISKPILNNIVFCHQDDSLWPFSENNVLKNIFDQLFDTKRFTKAFENFKEALKDYEKEKIELKGQLEYLKIGYVKYAESQSQSLTGLLQLLETSKSLSDVRQQLQPLKQKLQQLSTRQKLKNQLIGERGVLEYKLVEIQNKIQNIVKNSKNFNIELKQEYNIKKEAENIKIEQQRDQNQIYLQLKNVSEAIELGSKQLRILQRLLQQTKDKESTNKHKLQLQNQITRIKQLIPSLKQKSSQNRQQFIKQMAQKLKQLKKSQSQLLQAKNKISKIKLPPLSNFTLDQSQITKQQDFQARLKADLQILEKRIRGMYSLLYSFDVQEFSGNSITGQSRRAGQKLSKLQAQIQLKKSQLQKYKELKPRNKSIQRQIYEYKYTYIDLQNEMLQFMKKRKQCGMCMKKLNDQELQNVKIKINKTVKKGQQRIQELKRNYNPSTDIDPQPIIKEIEKFIEDNLGNVRNLEEEKKNYDRFLANQEKLRINKQLNRLMQQTQLKSEMSRGEKQRYDQPSLQKFKQLTSQYRSKAHQNKSISSQLNRNKQRYQTYRKQQQQYSLQSRYRKQLQILINKKQEQIKYLPILDNICNKIQQLWMLVNRGEEKGSSEEESSGELVNRIQALQVHLDSKNRQKLALQMSIQIRHLKRDHKQLQTKLLQLLSKQNQLQKQTCQQSQLQQKKNSLQLKQATLSQKQRIKKALYKNPSIIQPPLYLQKLLRYNTLCSLISDIQISIKCMERATNRLHNQKMDLINKILFDLWQEVYHAKDIQFIRIDAISEKKTTGYGYSIKMKKNGQLIDMKGRCSMGQKVLASIIIRMALAQAFSASTDILTLDQPTTNLDRIHIQNLAQSISSIVQMQQNSRLQLIIISHDMEFIKLLKKHAQYFYQITRNQNNFSVINKRDITQLGDDGRVAGIQAIHY